MSADKRTVPYPEMTDAMIDAGLKYLDSKSLNRDFSRYLPATFNWHEFWRAMVDAAPSTESANVNQPVSARNES